MKLELFEGKPRSILNGGFGPQDDPVLGGFDCSRKGLESLEGCPKVINGRFNCNRNHLTSLKFGPDRVGGYFSCGNNQITSTEHAPKILSEGASFGSNLLTSLKDIHKHIQESYGFFGFAGNDIRSHVLGLLKIKGLKGVILENSDVQVIINKHLNHRHSRNLLACQEELIDAGYAAFAQL